MRTMERSVEAEPPAFAGYALRMVITAGLGITSEPHLGAAPESVGETV